MDLFYPYVPLIVSLVRLGIILSLPQKTVGIWLKKKIYAIYYREFFFFFCKKIAKILINRYVVINTFKNYRKGVDFFSEFFDIDRYE